ncbi:MAG: TlpA disulfide reductase family protein [Terracidiphilus sp.]
MRRLCRVLLVCALAAGAQQPSQPALVGKPAPQFVRTALDGRTVDLGSLRGKVVLVNFWASWCGPCLVEMPLFAQWRRALAPDLEVVGVSMDDDAETARKATAKLSVDYPVLMGDAALAIDYGGILGVPVTFLVDRQGIVRYRFQGETDPAVLEARVRELIAAQ